jgi:branched-chain amino acid transport system substrate-binding protein
MAIEAALKGTPWPPTPQKLLAAMQSLSVDTKGLRGAPLEWSKDNHFRKRQCYRVYRWDTPAGKIVRVADWTCYDVK